MELRYVILRWWIYIGAALLFLISWRRAMASTSAGVSWPVLSTSFLVAEIELDHPECKKVFVYGSKGDQFKLLGSKLEIEREMGEAVVQAVLKIECGHIQSVSLPVFSESLNLAKPIVAIDSHSLLPVQTSRSENELTIPVNQSLELRLLLPSSGDRVTFDFGNLYSTVTINDNPVANTYAADLFEVRFPTTFNENELVQSSMLQPTSSTQVQPIVNACYSSADLYFPSRFDLSCSMLGLENLLVSKYGFRGKNLFTASQDGSYNRLNLPPTRKPLQIGEVVISEVMWAGSFAGETNQSMDEWIELLNTTEERIDLRGSVLEGGVVSGGALLINVDLVIEPFGYVLIGRSSGSKTQLTRDPDWVTSSLSLSNSEARLVLRTGAGIELDRTPSGAWLFGQNDLVNLHRSSVQRTNHTAPGSVWSSWGNCESSSPGCLRSKFWINPDQNQGSPWQPSVL